MDWTEREGTEGRKTERQRAKGEPVRGPKEGQNMTYLRN